MSRVEPEINKLIDNVGNGVLIAVCSTHHLRQERRLRLLQRHRLPGLDRIAKNYWYPLPYIDDLLDNSSASCRLRLRGLEIGSRLDRLEEFIYNLVNEYSIRILSNI